MTGPTGEPARAEPYRADIDGLRAVAVLAVIWYHSGLPGLTGGSSGVDVFFVISGYLIAGHVARDLDAGRFSLAEFYQRRVRRIAPALLATLVVTLLAGYALLLPESLNDLARSALASLALVPNMFFWIDDPAGYFQAIKRTPPVLLHMWTLGIEEQFYLFFPLLLLGAHRFRLVRPTIIAVIAGSFLLSALVASRAPTAAFYLLPTRAWELAAGALLSAGQVAIPPRWRALTSTGGLGLITAAFVLLDERMPYAAMLLALPVIGSALLIGSGPAAPANRLLAMPPLAWIGRISYSLYLLHWPILVLLQAPRAQAGLPHGLALGAIAAAIVLGGISYYLIEQPARRIAIPFRTVLIRVGAGTGLVLALALIPLLNSGLPGRFSAQALAMSAQNRDNAPLARRCIDVPLEQIERECAIGTGSPAAVIWGDSHAAADSAGIAAGLGQPAVLAAAGGCAPLLAAAPGAKPDRCVQRNRAMIAWLEARPRITTVVLVANWTAHRSTKADRPWIDLAATVAKMPGRRVVILVGTPGPKVDVPAVSAMRDHLGLAPLRLSCPPAKVSVPGALVVDLSAAFCAHPRPWLLFTDSNHPSATANREVIAPILRAALALPGN
jgi:peptidoglycan/LPS O-acetylase OafA/YrhL